MALYYLINSDNEFIYSGSSFSGATELDISADTGTNILPTTASTVAIKPLEGGTMVEYTRGGAMLYPSTRDRIELIDYSGIELAANTSFYQSPQGGARLEKFVFPRNSEYITALGVGGSGTYSPFVANSPRFTTVSCVEYGDGHLPDLPNCTTMARAFYHCPKLATVHIHAMDKVASLQLMFGGCSELINPVFHNEWLNVGSTESMFTDCTKLTSFLFPTCKKLTNMRAMFSGCTSLASMVLPPAAYPSTNNIKPWDSSVRLDIEGIFFGCTSLVNVNIEPPVRNLYRAFMGCTTLRTVNIGFVTNGFTASAFDGCTALETVTIGTIRIMGDSSSAHTTYTMNFGSMFNGCSALRSVLINLIYRDADATTATDHISVSNMFTNCELLTTITINNILDLSVEGTNVFVDCDSLVGGAGTQWDLDNPTDATYFRIDGGSDNPGYLTGTPAADGFTMVEATTSYGMIEGQGMYPVGSEYTLTYRSNTDIGADYWLKWDDTNKVWVKVGEGDSLTGTVTPGEKIFLINKYVGISGADVIVSLSSSPEDGGTVEGGGIYHTGSNVTIAAMPNEGFVFIGWYEIIGESQVLVSNNSTYTITGIGRNMNIVAKFNDRSNPYSGLQPIGGGGGNGTFDYNSEDVNSSLYSWKMNNVANATNTIYVTESMNDMGAFIGTFYIDDWAEAIKDIFDKIGTLGGNPLDYIQNVFVLPTGVDNISPDKYQFNMGIYDSVLNERAMNIATQRTQWVNMGSIKVDELYGNSLDYASEIVIWLPYIGYQRLDAKTVMGKTLLLFYYIDLMNGDCVADIIAMSDDGKFNSLVYQFNGNMAFNLPITNDNRVADILKEVMVTGAKIGTQQ